ncbi:hypothetical protein [Lactobacillus sp. Sy-1]|uniref:hypothetical protein n=1 Tax=Lactobacillus sp. Sy-1 TaxID=2109645 RepID=UPI001C5A8D71|nr:hypothetical protein [Lactobacillus sp. Sy-1]MBW1606438.1 hypothetical protein [Lactobacillus sp. Sy-1]
MKNKRVYMLQFISNVYGPRDFVAINEIDGYIIIGDAASTWQMPAIDSQVAETHDLIKAILDGIKRGYQLVVTSHHTNFLISTRDEIQFATKLLERRYYMTHDLII